MTEANPPDIRLSTHFCSRFQGVCAECPNRRASGEPRSSARLLPPSAEQTIHALARCRGLTKREREVLTLCCSGAKNAVIADTLGISVSAVRRHLRNLHTKTNTSDKADLILNLWHSSAVHATSAESCNRSGFMQ